MEIETFVKNFAAQFDEIDAAIFNPHTEFRNIEGWSSLIALSVIAMADEEYNVKLKGDDIRNSRTINDLFEKIESKM